MLVNLAIVSIQMNIFRRPTQSTFKYLINLQPKANFVTYPITKESQREQDMSHASAESKVPQKVQEKAPLGLEENLPDSVSWLMSLLFVRL